MSKIANKTIKALVKLGLDLDSGRSGIIKIEDVEYYTKDRHVSNGCKIIREDSFPFNCFKIDRTYSGASLKCLEFKGYRDVAYEKAVIGEKIEKLQKKVSALNKMTDELKQELEFLNNCSDTNKIYGKSDIKGI